MEASEVHELQELQEHEESGTRAVSFTMSLLAVLLAMTTVMGHRTHTEAVLAQARVSDQWNFYQAKKIRAVTAQNLSDLAGALPERSIGSTDSVKAALAAYSKKEGTDLDLQKEHATELEADVTLQERRASRFDLGEALLQIGVIVTSITLLTRNRAYWYMGMFFGAAGIVAAALAFAVH